MEADEAARRFCHLELAHLGRRLEYQLKQRPAEDHYGDDLGYRTMWDEYCHEVQWGATEGLDDAWDDLLNPLASDIADSLVQHVGELLTWYLDDAEGVVYTEPDQHRVHPYIIARGIISATSSQAMDRDLEKLMDRPEPRLRMARKLIGQAIPEHRSASRPIPPVQASLALFEPDPGVWAMTLLGRDLAKAVNVMRTRRTLRGSGAQVERSVTIARSGSGASIRTSDVAVDIDSSGTWPSPVRTNGPMLRKLCLKLAKGPIEITYRDGRLKIGTTIIDATEV